MVIGTLKVCHSFRLELLPRAVSVSVLRLQLGSVLMPVSPQGTIGTVYDKRPCSSLALGELALSLIGHRSRRGRS